MISEILTPQIDFLLMLQNFREFTHGFLDNFFMIITMFGEITIPTTVAAGIYWCINSQYGMFVLWNWGAGTVANELIKSTACIYRPWILDNRIQPIPQAFSMAGGYSFPSGHSQTAISIWGSIAYCFKRKMLTVFLIILILLIGFSRNYIGVHTPQDVIIAYVLALILIFILNKLMQWEQKGKNRDIIILAIAIASSFGLILFEQIKTYPMDYINGELLVDPIKMQLYAYPKVGLMLGIFTGWFLNKRFLNFDGSKGKSNLKLIRFITGIILLSILSQYGTKFFEIFISKKYAMFTSAFLSMFFITFLHPLITTNIENICQNQHRQNNKEV